jgi:Flp pilus assembly protein TadG
MEFNVTNGKHWGLKTKRPRGEAGAAIVETALVMPILMLLLVGAVELARVAYAAIEVSNAAKAAVAYGAQGTTQLWDTTGIQTAATNDAGDLAATLTTTPTVSGICSSGAACTGANSMCTNTDCATPGDHIEWILKVNTSATFNPLIHLTGLPTTFSLNGQAVQKVLPR